MGKARSHAPTSGVYKGSGIIREHVRLAELALGKPLPKGAEVHHVDGNRANNDPSNLVICPSAAYHQLLHIRTEALAAIGNASWRKCVFCKQWDDPANMALWNKRRPSKQYNHRQCHTDYERRRLQNRLA